MITEIKKYRSSDRQAVRQICADTAVLGEPVEKVFDDRETAADILVSYYTDHEPASCFVALCGDKVVGYLAGSVSRRRMRRIVLLRLPFFAAAFLRSGALCKLKTLKLVKQLLSSLFKGEFFTPDFNEDFPAGLHVNVAKGSRCLGAGDRLLDEYCKYLAGKGIKGVMLSTKSRKAACFFGKRGFSVLFRRGVSYLGGGDGAEVFIMGRKLQCGDSL